MSSEEYHRWNTRFAHPDYVFGTTPNAFLASCEDLLPEGGRALAIADGEGRNGVFRAECGLDTLSIDFAPNAQAKARALAESRGVALETRLVDILHWEWPEAEFDVVAAIFFQFCGPDDRAKIFAGLRRALKPGGLLLLEGYRPEQIAYGTGGPKTPENMYTREILEAAFGDFTDLDIRAYDADVDEGHGHVGRSALIDLVGRRPA